MRALTGHQPSPTTGEDARGSKIIKLDIERVAKALGVEHVRKADPWNLKEMQNTIEEAMGVEGPKLVIAERVCTLQAIRLKQYKPKVMYRVIEEKCIGCKLCIEFGCPANVFYAERNKAAVDPSLCVGCGMCAQLCPTKAIVEVVQ
ncbi:4Fe-4S binding protein [Candidatus Methanodesulfokora washburnensis]|nr:4Fe-4S binding protein [Candidatus Methanodesulfokores washburnensis]